jgi:excisionase family DNA binding protein
VTTEALPDVVGASVVAAKAVLFGIEIDGTVRLGGTPAEIAPLLGFSEWVVTKWCRDGVLRHRRIGRHVWIPASALAEFQSGDDRRT